MSGEPHQVSDQAKAFVRQSSETEYELVLPMGERSLGMKHLLLLAAEPDALEALRLGLEARQPAGLSKT